MPNVILKFLSLLIHKDFKLLLFVQEKQRNWNTVPLLVCCYVFICDVMYYALIEGY
jgi:hypothetical protein